MVDRLTIRVIPSNKGTTASVALESHKSSPLSTSIAHQSSLIFSSSLIMSSSDRYAFERRRLARHIARIPPIDSDPSADVACEWGVEFAKSLVSISLCLFCNSLTHLLQVVLQADARYRQDAEVADWVSQATSLLDSYTRAEWLPWGEPVGLLPITLQRDQERKRRAARQREVREAREAAACEAAQRELVAKEAAVKEAAARERVNAVRRVPSMSQASAMVGSGGGSQRPVRAAAVKAASIVSRADDSDEAMEGDESARSGAAPGPSQGRRKAAAKEEVIPPEFQLVSTFSCRFNSSLTILEGGEPLRPMRR